MKIMQNIGDFTDYFEIWTFKRFYWNRKSIFLSRYCSESCWFTSSFVSHRKITTDLQNCCISSTYVTYYENEIKFRIIYWNFNLYTIHHMYRYQSEKSSYFLRKDIKRKISPFFTILSKNNNNFIKYYSFYK